MSKPVLNIGLTTAKKRTVERPALVDTGSFYTIVRQDLLPKGTPIIRFTEAKKFRSAGKGGKVTIIGETYVIISIQGKLIDARAHISPDLNRECLIGAETMQSWDISIRNRNGHTRVVVGKDMRDPEITEVD